ncbi:threonine aldolase family protein, partial [candidate division KSB1 bacterium]
KAMMEAEVGDDVFNEDPTINRLQDMAAEIFNKEAAIYVPSGTMANELAIKVHTSPGDEVITDHLSHIVNFETGAPGFLSGVNLVPLTGKNGILNAEQVEKAIRPEAIQFARTGLISLENTHNYGGGSVYPIEKIKNITKIAQRKKVNTHLDGARIFNAVVATGVGPDNYAEHFDSITFCLSKGLGAPVGSVLMGTKTFIDEARRYRKIFGGGMRQAGILAAAGIYCLENNINRLAEDHENAKLLAKAFDETKTFSIDIDTVETNIIIVNIEDKNLTPADASARLNDTGILVFPFGPNNIRAVTHLDVCRSDIIQACERIRKYF